MMWLVWMGLWGAVAQGVSTEDAPALTRAEVTADLDLLVSALVEAHPGVYRYSSSADFHRVVAEQRAAISDSMSVVEAYNVLAPVVAMTREDHCDIALPREERSRLGREGRFMPLRVVGVGDRVYIVASGGAESLAGQELVAIDGRPIASIYDDLFATFAADGFVISSKVRWLDGIRLSWLYALSVDQPGAFSVTVSDPDTGDRSTVPLDAVDFRALKAVDAQPSEPTSPGSLELLSDGTAVLTVNTFDRSAFRSGFAGYRSFLRRSFAEVARAESSHLILDIRDNGGGSEGAADLLFSYLIDVPYTKYAEVEAAAVTFSFYEHTTRYRPRHRRQLDRWMTREHAQDPDGRWLRKPGIHPPAAPQTRHGYRGELIVLTSGWTYSGAAELASLVRHHTEAVFVGEEVGGAYGGNTSGWGLDLILPNSKVEVHIPLLEFVLEVDGGDLARGVIPDHPVQPTVDQVLRGDDAVMMAAQGLIAGR